MDPVTTSFDYDYDFDFDFDGFDTGATNAELSASASGLGALVAGLGIVFYLISMVLMVLTIVSMWKIFVKAGRPGWASLIPIYNNWVLLEVSGLSGWFILIPMLIPILVGIKLPEKFGKETAYAIGLIFLPIVFYPLLAFGKAEYIGAEVKVEEPVIEE